MMSALVHQRCFNHGPREAVARCPECGRFYCRECITEHADRMICTACLERMAKPALRERGFFAVTLLLIQLGAGVAALWLLFYLGGSLMISLPDAFHDGTLWRGQWMEEP